MLSCNESKFRDSGDLARQRRASTLTVRGFRRLNAAERGPLETEGAALLAFLRVEPVRPSA